MRTPDILDRLHEGLNEEQRRAVEATRGPVCILAGAGTGKTTTITRRIAAQVASGTLEAGSILAVTFTDRAAGEMRSRLEALGVEGVRARTFHSAALAQLRGLRSSPPAQILPSKALALRQIANTLPKPYRFRPAGDLATEIEWAKNRRIGPERYLAALGDHTPPIPAELMASVFARYERGKQDRALMDFEDLLELTIQMFRDDEDARERFSARYRAFTVDEYQDVNLLQETLLRAWLGRRDDLCVVGDDYQSIYGFTGASPQYLLDMPSRFVGTRVIRLETNYRSTPEILDLANRLVPKLGGAEKRLRAARPSGPAPIRKAFRDPNDELRFIVDTIRRLLAEGTQPEEIAILYRVNFRSEDHEEALAAAGIPFRVTDGAFLQRQTARQMLSRLKRSVSTDVAGEVRAAAARAGYLEDPPEDLGEQEMTRQKDLSRLIQLAEGFEDGTRTGREFAEEIQQRFAGGGQGTGVNLLTLHRAKGLEFDAVFLPRLEDGELPYRRARGDEASAEERRLFYVGMTRARTFLTISWVNDGRRKASAFIGEISPATRGRRPLAAATSKAEEIHAQLGKEVSLPGGFTGPIVDVGEEGVTLVLEGGAEIYVRYGDVVGSEGRSAPLAPAPEEAPHGLFDLLKKWRLGRARAEGLPAYVIFHDRTLEAIAQERPETLDQLASIAGIGDSKLERYGEELLRLLETGGLATDR